MLNGNILRIAEAVKERGSSGLFILPRQQILPYARDIFNMINEAYRDLYVVPLTDEQVDFYVKQYFSVANPDFVKIVVDKDNRMVVFGIGFPSLAKTLQKTKGKLCP